MMGYDFDPHSLLNRYIRFAAVETPFSD